MSPHEVNTGVADRYGRGYHGLRVNECPHCGRKTERVTLTLPNMGVKAKKCPWCSRSFLYRWPVAAWRWFRDE